jgi:hypothetical protein
MGCLCQLTSSGLHVSTHAPGDARPSHDSLVCFSCQLEDAHTLNLVVRCTLSCLLRRYAHDHGALPEGFPSLSPNPACQAFISNTSVALSLLLVFRTNA